MAYPGDSSYVLFHPENLGFSDVFSNLVRGKPLKSNILETKGHANATVFSSRILSCDVRFKIVGTLFFQKIFLLFHDSFSALGANIEYMLNFLLLNGGVFRSFSRFITGSFERPKEGEPNYRSIKAFIGRRDNQFSDTIDNITNINHLELCCRASEVAYENKNGVEYIVTNKWNAHCVGFYAFWNVCLKGHETQAFICSDRKENARLIVLAFRGTETFNLKDWATDIDLSWMSMGNIGRVHVGFMKALGYDMNIGFWPENYTGEEDIPAYYSLRDTLKELLEKNKSAKLLITGHSLGGALAILFPAILLFHGKHDLVSRVHGIYTFGQPRVGDAEFGKFVEANLNVVCTRYHRMVFRYDIVPRVPFDIRIRGFPIGFAHFGECLYYDSWYKGRIMDTEVNPNYFDPWYAPSKNWNACLDLFRALFAGIWHGSYFREPLSSIGLRIFGIVVCPGLSSHCLRDYKNSTLLANKMSKC